MKSHEVRDVGVCSGGQRPGGERLPGGDEVDSRDQPRACGQTAAHSGWNAPTSVRGHPDSHRLAQTGGERLSDDPEVLYMAFSIRLNSISI